MAACISTAQQEKQSIVTELKRMQSLAERTQKHGQVATGSNTEAHALPVVADCHLKKSITPSSV